MTIKEFFSTAWQTVKGFISGPGGRVLRKAIAAAIAEVGPALFAVLLDVAEQRARELEPSSISGDMKYMTVKRAVESAAFRAGITISKRLVNNIVENAALAAKGDK